MSSRPKYRAQPSFFDSGMYEACARWRHSRGGSLLTSFYGNGATKFDGLSDTPTIFKLFWKFLRTGLYHATGCKIFRRFRTTALPIVRLNSLRRIDGSTTNKPHSLTKREIQTRRRSLAKLSGKLRTSSPELSSTFSLRCSSFLRVSF